MRIAFTEDEMLILAIYQEDSKDESLRAIEETLVELEAGDIMAELLLDTIAKLGQITNEEYLQLDLREYDVQLDAIVAEAEEEGL